MSETIRAFIKQHQVESIVVAFVCVIILNIIFLIFLVRTSDDGSRQEAPVQKEATAKDNEQKVSKKTTSEMVVVDISGAVVHPGAYTVSANDRLSHVITVAGGLSTEADKDYFARNYNSAARLIDQQKIYVPRLDEVESGVFVENAYSIDHDMCILERNTSGDEAAKNNEDSQAVSINSASEQELDSLPSIGPVTAKKIIDGRPYDSLDKLVELKILSQKVFDELHDRLKL